MPAGYYKRNKEKFKKEAHKRYQNLSERKKKQKTSICSKLSKSF